MLLKSLLIVFSIGCFTHYSHGQTEVMSFNIRLDMPEDGENRWEYRKREVASMLLRYHPEILGIQEGMPGQVRYLDSVLADYAYVGFGRNGKGSQSEAVPIFYDSTALKLIAYRVFWLSETPDTISKGWDAAFHRITTYGAFLSKATDDTLHVYNCHFDHVGEIARENSAKLLIEKIQEYDLTQRNLIVMGDLNCEPGDAPYSILNSHLDDGMEIARKKQVHPAGTWNGFDPNAVITRRIDYIFCRGVAVAEYRHLDNRRSNNLWLSDHLPVLMRIQF